MTLPTRRQVSRPAPLDAAAIGASLVCLVHCLLLPILMALMPAISHVVQPPESIHVAVFLLAVPISAIAMLRGHRRHGLRLPAIMGALGLIFIGTGAAGGVWALTETGLTVAGSAMLAIGHAANWRLKARKSQSARFQS